MDKDIENVGLLSKLNYLFHFIVRSFLISILLLMFLFAILLFVYFGDLLINSGNKSMNVPLFSTYIIVSPSMVPTIMVNDAIVVKRIDNDAYNVGDIISFSSSDTHYNGLTVTHRIVDKKGINSTNSIYTTKGDNNPIIDATEVHTNEIYGRVLFKIPKIGYLKNCFSNPFAFIVCIISFALIFIIYDCVRVLKAVKESG